MIEARLRTQLSALAQMLNRARLWRALAGCWAVAAAVGLALLVIQSLMGREFHLKLWVMPLAVGVVLAGIVFLRQRQQADDTLDLIRNLEPDQPEVRHLLSAATEQRAAGLPGGFSFLQLRVIEEALAHPRREVWRRQLEQRLAFARMGHAGALLALLAIVLAMTHSATHRASGFGPLLGEEITVSPRLRGMRRRRPADRMDRCRYRPSRDPAFPRRRNAELVLQSKRLYGRRRSEERRV